MKRFIYTLVILVLFVSVEAQDDTKQSRKQSKEEKQAEQIKKVSELIESNNFVFNALKAVPLCGDPVSLEYLYSLKVDNGVISSYLPFYGINTEYKIENSPLIFANSYNKYSSEKEDNGYKITYNVAVEDDNVKLCFRITKFGFAYLQVTSEKRQGISFSGFIDEIQPAVFSSN